MGFIRDNRNSPLNIWNKKEFYMDVHFEKNILIGTVKHLINRIKWSKQRIVRGYADCDRWGMYDYLQMLIPDMLQNLKDNRMGSPSCLGENYTNDEGRVVNNTCHEEWDKILDRMIFLWRESREETCSRNNHYEEEYFKASTEFEQKYGILGEKLQTEAELEKARKRGGGGTAHFMDELPEYKEIYDLYMEEESRLEKYREQCQMEALDMLKKYFYLLWD